MGDSETTSTRPAKPNKIEGLDTPFKAGKLPEGVDEETRLFHGVDPETHERVSVSFEGLKAEFGEKLGEEKYVKIAGVGGGAEFFNPKFEATSYRPPLGISGLKGKHKTEVEAILSAKE